ncbi:MAG: hypothetical protein KAR20_28320, partial [Candidatus Heimdallarchaeota archaeon]|nr:hypothetical protein [Candidatus Heimdallarchaeota archaeon]
MKKYFIMPVLFILCSIINISGKDLYAIKNVTIIPVSSPLIQSGTIVIKGEKISALAKEVSIPPEAEIVDGTGLFAYPGMIDALSIIGLNEIGSVRATSDYRETGSLNSFIEAATAINPHSVH